jgi:hypothetical protein
MTGSASLGFLFAGGFWRDVCTRGTEICDSVFKIISPAKRSGEDKTCQKKIAMPTQNNGNSYLRLTDSEGNYKMVKTSSYGLKSITRLNTLTSNWKTKKHKEKKV